MTIYAAICTRSREEITITTNNLVTFFASCGIKTKILVNQRSIFEAYAKAFSSVEYNPDDTWILCHDDIQILDSSEEFVAKLQGELSNPSTGFIGPAGTTVLSEDAVWWNQDNWKKGLHRGCVHHQENGAGEILKTVYGNPGSVVCLDGLFLAAKSSTIKKVGLQKPKYFSGDWDFYDIHYTVEAFKAGFTNKAVFINMIHHSLGNLVGRESWHANRTAFIENNNLPMRV